MAKSTKIKYVNRFTTKADWMKAVQAVRERHQEGWALFGEDASLLMDTLASHPRVKDKVGCGIKSIVLGTSSNDWGNKCFFIVRVDGSREEFSYRSCISPKNPWRYFTDAMRSMVNPSIEAWKDEAFSRAVTYPCAECSIPLWRASAVVDHAHPRPFEVLVKLWLETRCLEFEALDYRKNQTGLYSFTDPMLTHNWVGFHNTNASPRLLCQRCNAKLGKIKPDLMD